MTEFNISEQVKPLKDVDDQPKILMVDDKIENLVALERILRDLPVRLFRATSGNEALRLTLHHDFALALLDIQMPEMDGYELASILREEEKTVHIPFIFISAIFTDSINVFQGYEKGAFSYITKPFEPEVLIAKVQFFVDKYHQEQALKMKTEQLQMINEELESFSYSVSHDLRAPLRAIAGFSQILQEKISSLEPGHARYLDMIVQNVDKMSRLIDDLLDFSRMSRLEKVYTIIDPADLVREIYKELEHSMDTGGVELTIGEMPLIRGDRAMISHVLSNLLSNAIKYSSTREKQLIKITAYDQENETVIQVKDNGVGFDTEYSNKLFKIFQRLHNEDEFEGTGVGLAIVKRIINRHNGRVWAEAILDEGATFSISLPRYES
ncbi:MAG: response regulator [Marinoscillum sp.]|uniref:sensor histidine kinase n=1 Tax=Marinoscillum sp. TaxID=2024838 RepID=UPI0032F73581